MTKRWSEIKEHNGIRKLYVDGKPWLALGIQYDFRNCTKVKDFDYLFKHTVKMGCNTVFFPLRWFVAEPREGVYDWTVLEHALKRCREHGLRMSLLWFGTNQGGGIGPAPQWVKGDKARFPRMIDNNGVEMAALCPNSAETVQAEKRAFAALLKRLWTLDSGPGTVIMLQIENEICIKMDQGGGAGGGGLDYWMPRCYCPRCNALYKKSKLNEWEFGVGSLTGYLKKLLRGQKRLFPVPVYVNYPINPLRPGEDVARYLDEVRELDFVAPDYYGFSPGDLAFCMQYFKRGRNMLLIAEHSTESLGEADQNLYLSVFEHGAQGFDPWAIDCAFGWRAWRDKIKEPPFVSRNGKWTKMARAFGDVQRPMRDAMRQVAKAVGSDDIMHYVSYHQPRKIEEKRWGLHWCFANGKEALWFAVRTGKGDVSVGGTDSVVVMSTLKKGGKVVAEEGRWEDDRWCGKRKLKAKRGVVKADLGKGTVVRIKLG